VNADALYWPCAAASLLGTWWNIQRRRAGFACWLATNAVWAHASFTHDLPAKGWLHVAYFGLAVVGLVRWRDPPAAAPPE
jgi:hypothetical protein